MLNYFFRQENSQQSDTESDGIIVVDEESLPRKRDQSTQTDHTSAFVILLNNAPFAIVSTAQQAQLEVSQLVAQKLTRGCYKIVNGNSSTVYRDNTVIGKFSYVMVPHTYQSSVTSSSSSTSSLTIASPVSSS